MRLHGYLENLTEHFSPISSAKSHQQLRSSTSKRKGLVPSTRRILKNLKKIKNKDKKLKLEAGYKQQTKTNKHWKGSKDYHEDDKLKLEDRKSLKDAQNAIFYNFNTNNAQSTELSQSEIESNDDKSNSSSCDGFFSRLEKIVHSPLVADLKPIPFLPAPPVTTCTQLPIGSERKLLASDNFQLDKYFASVQSAEKFNMPISTTFQQYSPVMQLNPCFSTSLAAHPSIFSNNTIVAGTKTVVPVFFYGLVVGTVPQPLVFRQNIQPMRYYLF